MYKLQVFSIEHEDTLRFCEQHCFRSIWLYRAFKAAMARKYDDAFLYNLRRV